MSTNLSHCIVTLAFTYYLPRELKSLSYVHLQEVYFTDYM